MRLTTGLVVTNLLTHQAISHLEVEDGVDHAICFAAVKIDTFYRVDAVRDLKRRGKLLSYGKAEYLPLTNFCRARKISP